MTISLIGMEIEEILRFRDKREHIEEQLSNRGWTHYFYKNFIRRETLFHDIAHYCRTDSKRKRWLLIIDWVHGDYELYKMDDWGNL